jgi:SAM-dependent methyltransferase
VDIDSKVLNEWRETAKYWARYSAMIRTMFAPLTEALIQHADIHAGQSVLDVAGGAGEPSLTIAEVVGPAGSVTCTDAVLEMVEAARQEADRRGLKNVHFRQCSADSLPFPDNSFDAVISRLGAMFFPDPHAAIGEMLRVVKPGGNLALAVWHKSDVNPFCYLVSGIMEKRVASPPADPDAPNAFRFAEPGKLARVVEESGAFDVTEHIVGFDIAAPLSPREFWTMRSQLSDTLRGKLTQLSEEEQSEVAREVEQAVQPFFPNNEMKFPAQMIVVRGTKRQPSAQKL